MKNNDPRDAVIFLSKICNSNGKEEYLPLGSGVCIADDLILTAWHVVSGLSADKIAVGGIRNAKDNSVRIEEIIDYSTQSRTRLDIVLLRTRSHLPSIQIAQVDFDYKANTVQPDSVYLVGYDNNEKTNGLESQIKKIDSNTGMYALQGFVAKGMSGGAVLKDDRLVGLIMARDTNASSCYFQPFSIKGCKDFLKKHLLTDQRSSENISIQTDFFEKSSRCDDVSTKEISTNPIGEQENLYVVVDMQEWNDFECSNICVRLFGREICHQIEIDISNVNPKDLLSISDFVKSLKVAIADHCNGDEKKIFLEFILPLERINLKVDTWRCSKSEPMLGHSFIVIVRPFERNNKKNMWIDLKEIPHGVEIKNCCKIINQQNMINMKKSDIESWAAKARKDNNIVIFNFLPVKKFAKNLLEAFINYGVPAILWSRAEYQKDIHMLFFDKYLSSLPSCVFDVRQDSSDDIGKHLTLLWDDKSRNPYYWNNKHKNPTLQSPAIIRVK